jgi:3-deoxy-D-manno-octulosonic-acid transferase
VVSSAAESPKAKPLDAMPLLLLYRFATTALSPLARPLLLARARRGKEDAARLPERMGFPGATRPEGRLVWLHGASVGEGLSLLPLVDRLLARGFSALVTTGTTGSAQLLSERLPPGAFHQYAPLDAWPFVQRFLDHWRPDLALFAESEIWPNMVLALKAREIPFALVNARISETSLARWRKAPGVAKEVFSKIDLCFAQDAANAARFLGLGVKAASVAGNLKFDSGPLPADPIALAELRGALGSRPVFAAVSTHRGEEAIAIDAHFEIAGAFPDLLTILAPRHPERAEEIMALAAERGLTVARRSANERPQKETAIYLFDTLGELGLAFPLAGVVFMGRSFSPGGGHNPIEPARFGCAVLHGPNVVDFGEIYAALDAAGGALSCTDARELARQAKRLFSEPRRLREMGRRAREVVDRLGGASQRIVAALEPLLAAGEEL